MITIGDAVKHRQTGQVGVVVDKSKNRLWVQTTPGITVVWYRQNVEAI